MLNRALAASYLLSFAISSNAIEIMEGRIVGCTDGDTCTLLDSANQQHEIRLASIDAPETSCHQRNVITNDTCVEQGMPFGKTAKRAINNLVFNKQVHVVLQSSKPVPCVAPQAFNNYCREIGTIWLNDLDVNLELVKLGLAWHYKKYTKHQSTVEFEAYSQAEKNAHDNHLGLWVDAHPIAPWDYRHSK
jgi:endonuclease YncB( thermonuclease family)